MALAAAVGNRAFARAVVLRQPSAPSEAPPVGGGPDSAPDGASPQGKPGLSEDAKKRLVYAQTVLAKVPPLSDGDRASLDKMVPGSDLLAVIEARDELRAKLEQAKIDLESAKDVSGADKPDAVRDAERRVALYTAELEGAQLHVEKGLKEIGVSSEAELVELVTKKFPELWKQRAKQIAGQMLDENLAAVEAQEKRYDHFHAPGHAAATAWDEVNDLRVADTEIATSVGELRATEFPYGGPYPSVTPEILERHVAEFDRNRQIGPPTVEQQREIAVRDKKAALAARWRTLGLKHVLLMHPSYRPGYLSSVGDEGLLELTGAWTKETREKIEKTRENVNDETLSLWHLRDVPDMTFDSLGVKRESMLGKAVAKHFDDRELDEEKQRMALQALAITLAAITAAAAAPAAVLLGALAEGAVTGYQIGQDLAKAQAVHDAGGVALDPALAKFTEEEGPDAVDLVTNLLSLGLVAGAALSAAQRLIGAYRLAKQSGEAAAFTMRATEVLGDSAKAVRLAEQAAREWKGAYSAPRLFDDYRAAQKEFMKAMRENPAIEVGIWQDTKTGKYVVSHGTPTAVLGPLGGTWKAIKHSHPGFMLKDRVPSAKDFEDLLRIGQEKGSAKEMIVWMDAEGKTRYTTYGWDKERGFWVRYADEQGVVQTKTFALDPSSSRGTHAYTSWREALDELPPDTVR